MVVEVWVNVRSVLLMLREALIDALPGEGLAPPFWRRKDTLEDKAERQVQGLQAVVGDATVIYRVVLHLGFTCEVQVASSRNSH